MKYLFLILFAGFNFSAAAQQAPAEAPGFKREKLFTGGNVNVGFSNRYTALGVSPQLGYSITDWADVGVQFGVNYISQRDYYNYGDKFRQTTFGPGAFVRLFPLNFLFATAQYEYNIIRQKYIPPSDYQQPSEVNSVSANSFLVGGGYAGGRQKGSNTYYFLSIMWDLMDDKYSPYTDELGRSTPIIRAGYNIGLFQGRARR